MKKGFTEINPNHFPLKIKKQWFKNDPKDELWIYDAGTSFPYLFTCPNCGEAQIDIQAKLIGGFNFTSFYSTRPNFEDEEMIAHGGAGSSYKFVQCESCSVQYYIGIGYIEPNNGRDVFVLHCIWEVEI